MKILIVYGTSEGHTRSVAERVAGLLGEHGDSVRVVDSDLPEAAVNVADFDAVLLAGSVHQERHQESLVDFVLAQARQIEKLPNAFISVSLAAASPDGLGTAQQYVERFNKATGFTPQSVLLLAGALKYAEYDYFKEQILKHVVNVPETEGAGEGDHVFTDWRKLEAFVREFAGHAVTAA